MARKEAINTWSDGLIMDLNPINTPNTALTDCLNGTIITYNGNEHSLQNDMGNYALENCALSKGYIPIGMKEYGGILYIVSCDEKGNTEIGSYPSPVKLDIGDETDSSGQDLEKATLIGEYESLVNQYNKTIIFNSTINPGDEYKIDNTQSILGENPWFYTVWGIVDENKNFHKEDIKIDANNFNKANWNIPGNIAFKQELINIENVSVIPTSIPYIKKYKEKVNVEENEVIVEKEVEKEELNIGLRVSFTINKKYIGGNIGKVVAKCIVNNQDFTFDKPIDLNNGYYKFIHNISGDFEITDRQLITSIFISNSDKTVNIQYPDVIYTVDTDVAVDPNTIIIGNKLWTYSVTDEEFTLNFDTEGLNNTISNLEYSLEFTGYDCNGNECKLTLIDSEWNKLGNSTYHFKFNNDFRKESIYKLVSKVSFGDKSNETSHVVITSELFNNINSLRYDNVFLNDWFGRYFVKTPTIKLNNWTITTDPQSLYVTKNNYLQSWEKNSDYDNYPRFIEKQRFNSIKDNDLYCNFSIPVNVDYSVKSNLKFLEGDLWDSTNESAKLIIGETETNYDVEIIDNLQTEVDYNDTITYNVDAVSKELQTIISYISKNHIEYNTDSGISNCHLDLTAASPKDGTATVVVNNPDAKFTYNISSWQKRYEVTPLNTINFFKEKLKKYDALFVPIWVVANVSTGNNKYIALNLIQDKSSTTTSEIIAKNNKTTGWDGPAYFALFKWGDKLQFVPILGVDGNIITGEDGLNEAFDKFTTLCNNIKYIKTDADSAEGGFITLKEINKIENQSINLKVNAELKLNKFEFNGYNLFKEQDRNDLNKVFGSSLNFTISPETELAFPNVGITGIDSNIIIEFDDETKSLLNAEKLKVKTNISNINTESIKENGKFISDKNLQLGENVSIYQSNGDTTIERNKIIDILNNKENNLKPYHLYFQVKNNPSTTSGDEYTMITMTLGYCNDEITINANT